MAELTFPTDPILVVDDEENILQTMLVSLSISGLNNVVTCQDSRQVEELLKEQKFSCVTLDLYMPNISGMDLLPLIQETEPNLPVIVVTGANEIDLAVQCMKNGAFDYLTKPVEKTRLITSIRNAVETGEIRNENSRLKDSLFSSELKHPKAFSAIVSQSPLMESIYKYVEAIAGTSLPILITGETGAGKELLARSVHNVSGRSGEFVPVNVAGLDDTLFSDTLFGHRKGAFTGAVGDREGMVKKAVAGTLFLDEIGDLGNDSQIKLLRLLQEREYQPLGSDSAIPTDARFIFATNHDLAAAAAESSFRKDLFFRLRSHHIHIPPLRERREDIPLLVDHFLEKAADEIGKTKPGLPNELFTLLKLHEFPGNIRELEGLIYDALVRHESGVLSLKHFRNSLGDRQSQSTSATAEAPIIPPDSTNIFSALENVPTLKACNEMLIQEALKRADGNQTIAAEILGMTRTALNKRLNRPAQ
jgi:DNA-binding NtrC family response regulator